VAVTAGVVWMLEVSATKKGLSTHIEMNKEKLQVKTSVSGDRGLPGWRRGRKERLTVRGSKGSVGHFIFGVE